MKSEVFTLKMESAFSR